MLQTAFKAIYKTKSEQNGVRLSYLSPTFEWTLPRYVAKYVSNKVNSWIRYEYCIATKVCGSKGLHTAMRRMDCSMCMF